MRVTSDSRIVAQTVAIRRMNTPEWVLDFLQRMVKPVAQMALGQAVRQPGKIG